MRAQFTLLLAALLACTLLPRPGAAMLLVGPGSAPARAAMELRLGQSGDSPTFAVAGTGRIPGSVLVLTRRPPPVLALLARGVIPVAVPGFLCGSPAADPAAPLSS